MAAKVSKLMFLPPALFAALAVLFFVGMNREDPDTLPSTFIGRAAPALSEAPLGSLPSFDRATLDQPGVKLVNFWASWCAPCRVEHPTLIKLAEEFPVYGVNQDRTEADALRFLADLGDPFSGVLFDKSKRQSIDWGVYGLPETFVIDGKGRVVYRHVGPLTSRAVQERLRPALQAAEN